MSITCLPLAFARHSSNAWANVAPCGWIDDAVRGDVEIETDQGDPLVVDEHVCDVVVGRSDDAAALDEQRHERISLLDLACCYLPPACSVTVIGL
jgi:hypothetical protein